jgi:hypothetical protein
MGKFDAFGVSDEGLSRMTLVNPKTEQPYIDKAGQAAWIDLHHFHGERGRAFELENERKPVQPIPGFTREKSYNIAKLAYLTADWYLVGADGEPLNVPCSDADARELYKQYWAYALAIVHANAYGNFTSAKSTSS